jgi:hypothetical protein
MEDPPPKMLTPEQAAQLQAKTVENIVDKIGAGGVPSKREAEILRDVTAQKDAKPEPKRRRGRLLAGLRWTMERAAVEFVIDRKTLSKRIQAASITPGSDGFFSTAQILEAMIGDYERERTRETAAAADIREMQRDEMNGKLVPILLMRGIFEEIGIAARQIIDHSDMPQRDKEQMHANFRKMGETDFALKVANQIAENAKPEPGTE